MNSYQNLLHCIDTVKAEGKTPKVIKLPTKMPRQKDLVLTAGYRTTGYRVGGVKLRGGNGHNAGGKVG